MRLGAAALGGALIATGLILWRLDTAIRDALTDTDTDDDPEAP